MVGEILFDAHAQMFIKTQVYSFLISMLEPTVLKPEPKLKKIKISTKYNIEFQNITFVGTY